jgi:DNA (cytosine-5)-methyltransferase 1
VRLLDLFCCEGGAGAGYAAAGFDVTGVDLNPRFAKRYPFTFVEGDALEYVAAHGADYDVIHASPPCQLYSVTRHTHSVEHPDLVAPTRAALEATGRPYVIENVVGAPLINPITLCGAAFGLTAVDVDGAPVVLRRHRLFESNVWLWPVECTHLAYVDRGYRIAGVYGAGSRSVEAARIRGGGYTPAKAVAAELMGAPWMTMAGLQQAIPPAYTRYLGEQLLTLVGV